MFGVHLCMTCIMCDMYNLNDIYLYIYIYINIYVFTMYLYII